MFPAVTKRYYDDIPQNFKPPAFVLFLIEQGYEKRLDKKYRSTVSFDLAYFSDKDTAKVKSDCLEKQEALLRGFDLVGGFRVINKTARITDNVLHLIFDVKYSETIPNTGTKMQTQETNTTI